MRDLFDAYSSGGTLPRNTKKAQEYLAKAADADAEWAQLLIASQVERSEKRRAMALYLGAARGGNCHAQARLAQAFLKGDLTDRNPTQAYFWALLLEAGGYTRQSEIHPDTHLNWYVYRIYDSASAYSNVLLAHDCNKSRQRFNLQVTGLRTSLTPYFETLAEDAVAKWRKGQQEPTLPAPPVRIASPSRETDPQPKEPPRSTEPPMGASGSSADPPAPLTSPAPTPSSPPRVAARPPETRPAPWPQWTPLPAGTMLPPAGGSRDLATLFATVSRSVWLVLAARSAADFEAGTGVAVGSAVAVSPRTLLTNCHVVSGRPLVRIKQGDIVVESTVIHGDSESDRCVLGAPQATLQPVLGMRRYNDLRVGESVYTIGSPRGLERSLGHGIVSGLRRAERQLLIQTTAQISAGSSGGGLFDQAGNLLGITTFRLKDSEGLNFAIAVEEYFRP